MAASQTCLFYVTVGLLLLAVASMLLRVPVLAGVLAVAGGGTAVAMTSKARMVAVAAKKSAPVPTPANPPKTTSRPARPLTSRVARFNPTRHQRPVRMAPAKYQSLAPPDDWSRGGMKNTLPGEGRTPVLDEPQIAQEDSGGSWVPPAPEAPTAAEVKHRRAMRARAMSQHNSWMEEDPEISEQLEMGGGGPSASVVSHAPQLAAGGGRKGLADFTPGLPSCCPSTPAGVIRNNGLYGIKGDYRCDIMKRSAVADAGFVEPLGARNEFMRYASYDMPNYRNQYMIKKGPSPGPNN